MKQDFTGQPQRNLAGQDWVLIYTEFTPEVLGVASLTEMK